MWECQFQKKKRTDAELMTFCKNRWTTCFKSWPDMRKIIEAVEKEEFFGALEVDLTVPKIWGQRIRNRPDFHQKFASFTPKKYFDEMCPIFLNTEVPITPDIIGDHMMDYVRQHKLSEKPRKLLLSGMRAEKVLLASPLVKWYLDHGLEITRVSDEKTFLRHITSYRLFSILNI